MKEYEILVKIGGEYRWFIIHAFNIKHAREILLFNRGLDDYPEDEIDTMEIVEVVQV